MQPYLLKACKLPAGARVSLDVVDLDFDGGLGKSFLDHFPDSGPVESVEAGPDSRHRDLGHRVLDGVLLHGGQRAEKKMNGFLGTRAPDIEPELACVRFP